MLTTALLAFLLHSAPITAVDPYTTTTADRPIHLVGDDRFDGGTAAALLRGLVDRAIATIQEYVEVDGRLPTEESARTGEFRLRLYPQGKSSSSDHVTAEGSFRLSPDADGQEFTLRFRSSPSPAGRSGPGEIL